MTQNCILRVTLPSVFVNFRQKPPKTVDFSQWCITYTVACCCSQQQGWVSSGFAAVAFYGMGHRVYQWENASCRGGTHGAGTVPAVLVHLNAT